MKFLRLTLATTVCLLRRSSYATGSLPASSGHFNTLTALLPIEVQQLQKDFDRLKRQKVFTKLQELSPDSTYERVTQQIDTFYIPLYLYLKTILGKHRNKASSPLFVGISAPQGCGKTTLTTLLEILFDSDDHLNCISCSLDDFYITGENQERLALSYPDDPLLQYRGNAGTHDMVLLSDTLARLKRRGGIAEDVLIPKFDKSLRGGRGDRSPESSWRHISASESVDIVLFEGWMLGFEPLPLDAVDPALATVNALLKGYRPLHDLMDTWIVLAVESIDNVYNWRLQAERNMGRQGRPRLSDDQVKDFVNRFMPAYHAYLPRLYKLGPRRSFEQGVAEDGPMAPELHQREKQKLVLKVDIGADRNVEGCKML